MNALNSKKVNSSSCKQEKVKRQKRKNWFLPLAFCLLPLVTPFTPSVSASSPLQTLLAQTPEASKAQAEQLLAQGVQQLDANQVDAALQSFQQTLDIQRQTGNRFEEAVALNNLGVAYDYQGKYEEAIASYRESMKIFWDIYDRSRIAASLNNQSIAHLQLGQYQKAIELCHGAIAIFRNMGNLPNADSSVNRTREAAALNNMGLAYEMMGEYERAIGYFQEALVTAQDNGDARGELVTLSNLGEAYSKLGQAEQAKEFEQQASAISQEIGKEVGAGGVASSSDRLLVRQKERSLVIVFSKALVN
jgi:tetratricopeptide (TPR) repeat protein